MNKVAAVVNSRPLTYMVDDPSELETLKPNMFLRKIKEDGVPDLDAIDAMKLNEMHRYRLELKEDIRKRFRSEYMSQLVHRKGSIATRPIELGELVLVSNENQKRTLWPVAKAIKIYPGKDGVIRVARVKTSKGELERDVKVLVPLEIRQNENIPLGISAEHQAEILSLEKPASKKTIRTKRTVETIVTNPNVDVMRPVKTTKSGREVKQFRRLGIS